MTFGVAPAALAAPAGPLAAPAEPSTVSDVADAGDEQVAIAFAETRLLVEHHRADGGVTDAGAERLLAVLDFAELQYDFGYHAAAAGTVERMFKLVAEDPDYVPSESARDELLAAADDLIATLGGTP